MLGLKDGEKGAIYRTNKDFASLYYWQRTVRNYEAICAKFRHEAQKYRNDFDDVMIVELDYGNYTIHFFNNQRGIIDSKEISFEDMEAFIERHLPPTPRGHVTLRASDIE